MKNTVCVIGVYFGKFPNYIDLWLRSVEKNPGIDFLVFTDAALGNVPANVHVYPTTLGQIESLAEEKLGMQISLEKPYKCCDFRPAFGVIFQEYLKDYEYWGHCDFDMIYGDIAHFMQEYDYQKYDRFLHLGHLSFYRNTEAVNQYYKLSGSEHGYAEVFSQDRGFAFDEVQGIDQILLKNGLPLFYKRIFADISPIYKRFRLSEYSYFDQKDTNYAQQAFYWENGKAFRAYWKDGKMHTDELVYIHFQKRPNFALSDEVRAADAFYITNEGFVPKTAAVTAQDIAQRNPYPGALYEKCEFWKVLWKERMTKVLRLLHLSK